MPAKKKRSKKKSGAARTTEKKSSGLSWMVMGLLVGLFVAFLVYLDKIPGTDKEQYSVSDDAQGRKSSVQKEPDKSDDKKAKQEHQFDFYTVLPDREVEVIDVQEEQGQLTKKKIKPAEPQKNADKTSQVQSAGLYQLQVGAFKELSKADAMKARLAFLGVESNIQVIRNTGHNLYRVRVGPSTDNQKIMRIKKQLQAQNINTFVQKL